MGSYKNKITESKIVPLAVTFIALWVILTIPFKIISYGFLPPDDALRHAAKAVSDKDWSRILVLRDDIKMDPHPGWHAILGAVHKAENFDTHSLVLFSIIFLFFLVSLVPIILLERPEAWLIALLAAATAYPSFIFRMLLGRPYIVTIASILAIGILWPKLREKKTPYGVLAALTTLVALSTWIHGGWYYFILPAACFYIARQWRPAFLLTVVTAVGSIIGASWTGHPWQFLNQTVYHIFISLGNVEFQRFLVSEFQPFGGDFIVVSIVLFMLIWRSLRGEWETKFITGDPVFILAIAGWSLGFITTRAWIDLGVPATILWIAQEFQSVIKNKMPKLSFNRLFLVAAVAGILWLSTTNDISSRWSETRPKSFISLENAKQAPWLPSPGGILYSDDMSIFYQVFFKNPHAEWRYVLGFEPALMKPDDLAIFRNIQATCRAFTSFGPWVRKMTPKDRLIIRHMSEKAPNIPGLEWGYVADGIWSGRIPINKTSFSK